MAYYFEQTDSGNDIVINGFEKGIAQSPYMGIASIRNMNTNYYPGVGYLNYRRRQSSLTGIGFYAGTHSTNVSGNTGWVFNTASSVTVTMDNPVSKTKSDAGLNYIQDASGAIWKQDAVNSTGFSKLGRGLGRKGNGAGGIAYWNKYLVVFGDGYVEFCGDGSGDAGITSEHWNQYGATGLEECDYIPIVSIQTPASAIWNVSWPYYSSVFLTKVKVGDPVQLYTSGTMPAGFAENTTYYIKAVTADTLTLAASYGGTAINYTTNGTGYVVMRTLKNILPLGDFTNVGFAYTIPPGISGSVSEVISSFTNTQGTSYTFYYSVYGGWYGPNGSYRFEMPNGQEIRTNVTDGGTDFEWPSPFVYIGYDQYAGSDNTWNLRFLDRTVTDYRPYVSKADGNLYFCNGRHLGRILAQNENISFKPSISMTYTISYGVVDVLDPNDTITDMTDLKSTLVVAGEEKVYTWDYISPNMSSPSPVGEPIHRIINLLNNIYILAGQKGNIYISNGYSSQLFYKIPDYISGVIDPVFAWGDLMVHRSKLFFQSLVKSNAGANILAGIFSLIVSPTQNDPSPLALTIESQNSYGLTPASGALANGLLIDNPAATNGIDNYYSAWSNGASTGGIDYNDTSVWQNWEGVIETDIIPLGSILEKRTLSHIMFKLDRPMVSGDAIRISWRPSLSDSYTLMGTTTTTQLSDYYQSNIHQAQWAQFKIEFKGASSGSSRIPLQEVRIQTT